MGNSEKTRKQLLKKIELLTEKKANLNKTIDKLILNEPKSEELKTNKKIPAELTSFEKRINLKNIFDSMNNGVYIINKQYYIEYLNPTVKKVFGTYSGEKCYEYFHHQKEPCKLCKNTEVWEGKTAQWEFYASFNKKNYEIIDTPFLNLDGTISKLGMYLDITERKHTEAALQKEKEYYQSFLESLNDWVWEMDLEGNHTFSNNAVESILGYKAEEVVGHNVMELWLDLYKTSEQSRILKKSLTSGKGWKNIQGKFKHKKGSEVITESSAIPIFNSKNILTGYRGIDHDITERKQAEEELRVGRMRLKMLNKIIRHDLSNDFSVIQSAINIYKRSSDKQMITEIEKRVVKSLKTITEYKKYENYIYENTDLKIIKLSKLISSQIAEFPQIAFSITGDGRVFADEALSSVFTNLITNAIYHGKSTKINIAISSNNEMYEIRFMDNGLGIPDDKKDKIFDEGFYYGKTGHTGIGLYIVKQTIERYGGNISLEDNIFSKDNITVKNNINPKDNIPQGAVFIINLKKVF